MKIYAKPGGPSQVNIDAADIGALMSWVKHADLSLLPGDENTAGRRGHRRGQGMSKLDDTRTAVATRIRQAREAQGVTQTELARRVTAAGWQAGTSTITKIESGRRRIEVVEAALLADALDLRVSELVAGAHPTLLPERN